MGSQFLYPGTRNGGSCFQKDTKAFIQFAGNIESSQCLLKTAGDFIA
ncbi:hypothetical protein ACQCVE_05920 [Metabacillus sp. 113a]